MIYYTLQSEWYDGTALAENIQFRFPECPKILPNSWHLIVPRASQQGIQLIIDLLKWNPDLRPNSLQSMKYPLFAGANQNIEREREQRNLMASEFEHNNFTNSSIIPKDFVQKSSSLNSLTKNLTQTSTLNIIKKGEEHLKSLENSENDNESKRELEKSKKSQTKFTANFNVINELFKNFKQNNSHNNGIDGTTNCHQDLIKNEPNGKNNIFDNTNGSNKMEKVNDVYINLSKKGQDWFGEVQNVPAPEKNSNSFFLHEPKVNNSMRSNRKSELDSSKSSLNFLEKTKKSFSDGDFANNIAKERERFAKKDEDDELASVLG